MEFLEVRTGISKTFLQLTSKNFREDHKLTNTINRSNYKISYSYMKNINKIIQIHNRKCLKTKNNEENKTLCNCRIKTKYPLNIKRLIETLFTKLKLI